MAIVLEKVMVKHGWVILFHRNPSLPAFDFLYFLLLRCVPSITKPSYKVVVPPLVFAGFISPHIINWLDICMP